MRCTGNQLSNLTNLKKHMIDKKWIVDVLHFSYPEEKKHYYMFLEIIDKNSESKYSNKDYFNLISLIVTFREKDNFDNKFSTAINAIGFLEPNDMDKLIEYFSFYQGDDFDFRHFLNGIFRAFEKSLDDYLKPKDDELKDVLCKELDTKSGGTGNGRYCYDIRRLPEGKHRTAYNTQKAKMFAPAELFEHFTKDDKCSFYFSPNSEAALTAEEITNKYTKRHNE